MERSEGKEEEIFKKSKLVIRSPRKEETEEGRRLEEWMKEVGGGGLEGMREEIREGFREQEKKMMAMVESMRKEFNEQRREWGKEKGVKERNRSIER